MTDSGVLLHDILGGIILAALVVIGILFNKRQHRQLSAVERPGGTPVDRKFAKIQIWALYWLAIGGVIAFFFVWPRAESRTHEPSPAENAKGQKL